MKSLMMLSSKVKVLKIENTETKLRIESLETWLLKLNDKVEDVTGKTDNTHLKNLNT